MAEIKRYKCKLCGYIYSPLRGEPHNGIPAGTNSKTCQRRMYAQSAEWKVKGRSASGVSMSGYRTKFVCSVCGYVYDQNRGEPHRGIKAGTPFSKLPDDYRCPVCNLDPKIKKEFGPVGTNGFEPLYV